MTKNASSEVLRRLDTFVDDDDAPPTREELEAEAERADALDAELDPRWTLIARGGLDEADRGALAAESAELHDAFRPLDASFRDQVVDSLRAPHRVAAVPASSAPVASPPAPAPPRVLARRRIGGPLVVSTFLAAAAALTLVLLPRDIDPLPSYALELRSGDQSARGHRDSRGPIARHAIGSRLEIVARPREPLAPGEQIAATAFVVRDGEARRIDRALRVAEGGAVRLVGTVGDDLPLALGTSELAIVITRPDAVPVTLPSPGDDAIILRMPIEVVGAP